MSGNTIKTIGAAFLAIVVCAIVAFIYHIARINPAPTSQSMSNSPLSSVSAASSSVATSSPVAVEQAVASSSPSAEWSLPGRTISLTIASTSAEQELGLGDRAALASTSGMLFVFDSPDNYGFWMKDMQFPLDIIWLDQNFKIIHIERGLLPSTYPEVFFPGSPTKYVIEVNAGFANANSLSVGQTMQIK